MLASLAAQLPHELVVVVVAAVVPDVGCATSFAAGAVVEHTLAVQNSGGAQRDRPNA